MNAYASLRDAVLDLDLLLIETLGAFSIETSSEGYRLVFRFMLYGPHLERAHDVEQCPDVEALLDGQVDPRAEIASLEECEIVGALNSIEIQPGWPGNSTDSTKWLVKTHAGSQAERIEWRNSIG